MNKIEQLFTGIDANLIRRRNRIDPQSYPEIAALAYEILDRTLYRLSFIKLQPQHILLLSPIPGHAAAQVQQMYPTTNLHVIDLSEPLVAEASKHKTANFYSYPWNDLSASEIKFDLIISHLHLSAIPLQQDLFIALQDLLLPDGVLMAATFGVDTLKELVAAFRAVDQLQHVNPYPDMHDLGDMLVQAGFVHPVVDMTQLEVQYHTVDELLYDLRHAGICCFASNKVRGLYSPSKLQQVRDAYEASSDVIAATFEVIFVHGFRPKISNKKLSPTQTAISADSIPVLRR